MKDYTIYANDQSEKDTFIEKYEIVTKRNDPNYGKIVLYFANGSKHYLENTIENQMKVLSKMENQIKSIDKSVQKNIEDLAFLCKRTLIVSLFFLIGGIIVLNVHSNFVLGWIFTAVGGVGTLLFSCGLRAYKEDLADLKKNQLFVENSERINEMFSKNKNVLNNVNKKIINAQSNIYDADNVNKAYTINSIDKLKLNDLKEILEIIKREELFCNEEEFAKTMVKKR